MTLLLVIKPSVSINQQFWRIKISFSDSDLKQNIQSNFLYSICILPTDHHTSLGKVTLLFRRREMQSLALIIRIARVGITTKTQGDTIYMNF